MTQNSTQPGASLEFERWSRPETTALAVGGFGGIAGGSIVVFELQKPYEEASAEIGKLEDTAEAYAVVAEDKQASSETHAFAVRRGIEYVGKAENKKSSMPDQLSPLEVAGLHTGITAISALVLIGLVHGARVARHRARQFPKIQPIKF